jgi:hypothetical protein
MLSNGRVANKVSKANLRTRNNDNETGMEKYSIVMVKNGYCEMCVPIL